MARRTDGNVVHNTKNSDQILKHSAAAFTVVEVVGFVLPVSPRNL